ncbi:hypothetical protein L227DRAFT_153898 [Lentinus tigrinus ALCF2SS1-6]|uniref:Uncharacterized protein n=1 Tax=Lentinus tigrinus ALCF2SS1-6 TaxID=1328759 RepID=A0A5C2S7E4_9APHY|nr:hypothetical protein L227DRAFT_153898 [Lentinus tigrinus ALCF2SS1-6]
MTYPSRIQSVCHDRGVARAPEAQYERVPSSLQHTRTRVKMDDPPPRDSMLKSSPRLSGPRAGSPALPTLWSLCAPRDCDKLEPSLRVRRRRSPPPCLPGRGQRECGIGGSREQAQAPGPDVGGGERVQSFEPVGASTMMHKGRSHTVRTGTRMHLRLRRGVAHLHASFFPSGARVPLASAP